MGFVKFLHGHFADCLGKLYKSQSQGFLLLSLGILRISLEIGKDLVEFRLQVLLQHLDMFGIASVNHS